MRKVGPKLIRVGQGRTRYLVVYFNEPSPETGVEGVHRQFELLRFIVEQPALMNCGPSPFQKLRVFYTGQEWAMELEATVEDGDSSGNKNNAA